MRHLFYYTVTKEEIINNQEVNTEHSGSVTAEGLKNATNILDAMFNLNTCEMLEITKVTQNEEED